jgi:hypothetical protein
MHLHTHGYLSRENYQKCFENSYAVNRENDKARNKKIRANQVHLKNNKDLREG